MPKKFEWTRGDYIYIPPFTTHQHFATAETRLIMMSNRMVKEMGYDWFDQVENAPGFVIIDEVSISQTEANRPLAS